MCDIIECSGPHMREFNKFPDQFQFNVSRFNILLNAEIQFICTRVDAPVPFEHHEF